MPESQTDAVLEQRYARRRSPAVSRRALLAVLAAGILVAGAFIVWTIVGSDRPTTKDVGFELLSSSRITADFELTKGDDDVVRCGVEALNQNYAVVGYTETTIGEVPADQLVGQTSAHRVEIRTTNQANSARVAQCWTVD